MKKDLELRHLRYFVAVAEELHFGRAAARLHISQPPLSHQIQYLEQELGTHLLDRDKHHVALTEAGRVFLSQCRKVLHALEGAKDAAQQAARREQHRLRVGVSPLFDVRLVLRLTRALFQLSPRIELDAQTTPTVLSLEEIWAGRMDAAILAPPPVPRRGFMITSLGRVDFRLFVNARHPLARQRVVSLSELGREPLVGFHRSANPALHDLIWHRFRKEGYRPAHVHRVQGGLQVSAAFIREGLGVAFFPAWMGDTLNREIRAVPLSGTSGLGVDLALVHRDPPSAAVRTLREIALTLAGDEGAVPTEARGHGVREAPLARSSAQ